MIVLLMTPLQAAGEEYFFRGWIMQNVGAWFARPMVGLVASLAVSAVGILNGASQPGPVGAGQRSPVLRWLPASRPGGPVGWRPALRCTRSTTC